jgi:hypothetical protein
MWQSNQTFEEVDMKSSSVPWIKENRLQWLVVALALVLLIAFIVPQVAWADHASAHPQTQAEVLAEADVALGIESIDSISSMAFYRALLERYLTGTLEFNAPGR